MGVLDATPHFEYQVKVNGNKPFRNVFSFGEIQLKVKDSAPVMMSVKVLVTNKK